MQADRPLVRMVASAAPRASRGATGKEAAISEYLTALGVRVNAAHDLVMVPADPERAAALRCRRRRRAPGVNRQRKRVVCGNEAHVERRQASGDERLNAKRTPHEDRGQGPQSGASDQGLGCTSGTAARAASPALCSSTGQRQLKQPRARCGAQTITTRAASG